MTTCHYCSTEKNVETCVSCNTPVCKEHSGYLLNKYISEDGRRGRGCKACIDAGTALPEYGTMSMHLVVPDAVRRLEHKIYPRIFADVAALTVQTKQDAFDEAKTLLHDLEDSIQRISDSVTQKLEISADRIVSDTLEQARMTLRELTGEITNAITHQRVEVTSDAEKIVHEIRKTTREAIYEASVAINAALIRATLMLIGGLGGIAIILAILLRS